MTISLTIDSETPEGLMADIRTLFPSALPPMQEQPSREPLPPENVKERKTRKPKEDAKADAGEPAPAAEDGSASSKESSSAPSTDPVSSEPSNDAASVPDIEDLRARLKTLGATEGLGHDKVFEVLGKYGAKNASTVPEAKRATCIAEIDGLLAKLAAALKKAGVAKLSEVSEDKAEVAAFVEKALA